MKKETIDLSDAATSKKLADTLKIKKLRKKGERAPGLRKSTFLKGVNLIFCMKKVCVTFFHLLPFLSLNAFHDNNFE